jgi:Bacterial Ig-like domain (group 1)
MRQRARHGARWQFGRRRFSASRAGMLALAVGVALLSACRADRALTAPGLRLQSVDGDGQHAAPGAALPRALVVRLVDGNGQPIVGARIDWHANGGTFSPATSITDATGTATTTWMLGARAGEYVAEAVTSGSDGAAFDAWVDVVDPSALQALHLVTYDGSGQVVHPDIAHVPEAWGEGPMRLAVTPYPEGNANFENPSLFAGADGVAWTVPSGVVNPLVRPDVGSYLSDPDIVFDPDAGAGAGELRLYYREVTTHNRIWLTRSGDGRVWSAPVLVVEALNHEIVSPTVVRRAAGDWLMWSVNAGAVGCSASSTTVELRHSADGVQWSAPQTVSLAQSGGSPWHLDVEWIPSRAEFWALYPLKVPGGCTTSAVYLATSADGVHWTTHPAPVLSRGALPELQDVVYRSTLDYDARSDVVTLWYSGARYEAGVYRWHAAVEQIPRTDLFARLSFLIASAPTAATAGPGLTNATAP